MQGLRWTLPLLAAMALVIGSCAGEKEEQAAQDLDTAQTEEQVVNVYTHRHYDADKQLFARFAEQTGITVNVVKASADELIKRLEVEGKNSPADVLVTVDAGRLHRARELGLLQPIESAILSATVPQHLRDPQGYWYGLTVRARVFVHALERVKPEQIPTYESLAEPVWKGRIVARSSSNVYNQSLLASLILNNGKEAAANWSRTIVSNLARPPKGNDRDQIKAIAAGIGDVAFVNTYYVGMMLASEDAEERAAVGKVGVVFPNQSGRGTHINVSGAGVTTSAKNKENAVKLLEFLLSTEAQGIFAEANYEYPVNRNVPATAPMDNWGEFKADSLALWRLGAANADAVAIFEQTGWN